MCFLLAQKLYIIKHPEGISFNFYFGQVCQIILFKSCYPNNNFSSSGQEPGNSSGSDLTVTNAKAAYTELLPEFTKNPKVHYVVMTAPPLIVKLYFEPLWKFFARKILRRPLPVPSTAGPLAREFNNWLKSETGWLKTYEQKNVVVFDYYDILAAYGKSNYAEFASKGGNDNHPNSEGNTITANAFVPFLNQAVHRAGLAPLSFFLSSAFIQYPSVPRYPNYA